MKKILYIDMDGVIADFASEVEQRSDGKRINPGSNADWVFDVCIKHPYIFEILPPIPFAIESVKKLFELYDVYFLSMPMWEVPESYTAKRKWLETHFGDLAKNRLILTSRKDLAIGDILIDDRLVHGVDKFNGLHIHYGQQQYRDWGDVMLFLQHTAKMNMEKTINAHNFFKHL